MQHANFTFSLLRRWLLRIAIVSTPVAGTLASCGGDDSATQYFRRTTSEPLALKFKPIVQKAMAKVKLADKYDQFAGKAAKFGLLKEQDAHLDDYVTQKTLDGLYLMIAEEEKAIRQDPLAAAGKLARKVFGTLQ